MSRFLETQKALVGKIDILTEQRDEARSIANATLAALNETKTELAGAMLVLAMLMENEVLASRRGKYEVTEGVVTLRFSTKDVEEMATTRIAIGTDTSTDENVVQNVPRTGKCGP